jgi:hypothetical protein
MLKRIRDVRVAGGGVAKFKAIPGQYVFLYRTGSWPNGMTDDEYIRSKYVVPDGMSIIRVSDCFLRGTPTFTKESLPEYLKYVSEADSVPQLLLNSIEGGSDLRQINLYPENFPKHLHWSSLLGGLTSQWTTVRQSSKGGSGTDLCMNDPISGGIKYAHMSGSGNYKLAVHEYGSEPPISHWNLPKYQTLAVYQFRN